MERIRRRLVHRISLPVWLVLVLGVSAVVSAVLISNVLTATTNVVGTSVNLATINPLGGNTPVDTFAFWNFSAENRETTPVIFFIRLEVTATPGPIIITDLLGVFFKKADGTLQSVSCSAGASVITCDGPTLTHSGRQMLDYGWRWTFTVLQQYDLEMTAETP